MLIHDSYTVRVKFLETQLNIERKVEDHRAKRQFFFKKKSPPIKKPLIWRVPHQKRWTLRRECILTQETGQDYRGN